MVLAVETTTAAGGEKAAGATTVQWAAAAAEEADAPLLQPFLPVPPKFQQWGGAFPRHHPRLHQPNYQVPSASHSKYSKKHIKATMQEICAHISNLLTGAP